MSDCLPPLTAIIFDFDGVILDSVDVKTHAFAQLVAPHGPDAVRRMTNYHRANGGISRFKKFEWFAREVLGRELSGDESSAMGRQFENLALDGVLNAPFIAGAREFLGSCELPLFVASGTPETELHHILERRGLTNFFREAHGSPRTKTEIIRDLLTRHSLDPEKTLFVGDAMTDFHAATECGLPFLGIATDGTSPFPPGTALLPDLTMLRHPDLWGRRMA